MTSIFCKRFFAPSLPMLHESEPEIEKPRTRRGFHNQDQQNQCSVGEFRGTNPRRVHVPNAMSCRRSFFRCRQHDAGGLLFAGLSLSPPRAELTELSQTCGGRLISGIRGRRRRFRRPGRFLHSYPRLRLWRASTLQLSMDLSLWIPFSVFYPSLHCRRGIAHFACSRYRFQISNGRRRFSLRPGRSCRCRFFP